MDNAVTFKLVTGGERLDTVEMRIYAGSNTSGPLLLDRTLNVHSSGSTVSASVNGLPEGDYLVVFSATAVNSGDGCLGQQPFHIDAHQTHVVTVLIMCGAAGSAAVGNVVIKSELITQTPCPYLRNVFVAPLQVGVGTSADLSASFSDQSASVVWASSADGSILFPNAPSTQYTCSSAGTKVISVSLTKPPTACLDTVSLPVVCVD
jgi:hypothetical protein